jgi:hypothetical protein
MLPLKGEGVHQIQNKVKDEKHYYMKPIKPKKIDEMITYNLSY